MLTLYRKHELGKPHLTLALALDSIECAKRSDAESEYTLRGALDSIRVYRAHPITVCNTWADCVAIAERRSEYDPVGVEYYVIHTH